MNYEQTKGLIENAYAGQFDRSGRPMAEHAIRVSEIVQRFSDDPDAPVVALLHDIIEDTDLHSWDLDAMGFSPRVVRAVLLLTHLKEFETYEEYVQIIADSGNKLAAAVKLADNLDNSSEWRHTGLPINYSLDLKHRYRVAREILLDLPSPVWGTLAPVAD